VTAAVAATALLAGCGTTHVITRQVEPGLTNAELEQSVPRSFEDAWYKENEEFVANNPYINRRKESPTPSGSLTDVSATCEQEFSCEIKFSPPPNEPGEKLSEESEIYEVIHTEGRCWTASKHVKDKPTHITREIEHNTGQPFISYTNEFKGCDG
jgi:hypothetical protein